MESLKPPFGVILLAGVLSCSALSGDVHDAPAPEPIQVKGLKTAAAFATITDDQARSQALFIEAGKVIQHARCVNCHPTGDRPRQTDAQHLHQPPVVRGEAGHGAVGMQCGTCHQEENVDLGAYSIPGHEGWHLAPASMGWAGQSLSTICEQVKDPARNGDRELKAIVEHMAKDGLVGWAWHPGSGRAAAPGTQEVFGGLIRAWAAAGAHCPPTVPITAQVQ